MATNRGAHPFAHYARTPWDDLIFKLYYGWGNTGKAFQNRYGQPGTIKFVRKDDPNGTMHLEIDMASSDVGPGWAGTSFNFVDGNVLTLGEKFPQLLNPGNVNADWERIGDDVIALMENPDLKLAIIEGKYDRQFPVYGIFLPDSVMISGGRLAGIFLFAIATGSAPDGGATGPPPPN